MSLKVFGNPENEEGQWFPFKLATEGESVAVEFKVRRVPSGKEDELSHRHYGRKTTLRFKKGAQIVDRDSEKLLAFAIDKASFALLDSRGFPELEIGDPEAAQTLSQALGREVQVGEMVPVDEHWTPELKRYLLNVRRDVLRFVNDTADKQGGWEADEEKELGKT